MLQYLHRRHLLQLLFICIAFSAVLVYHRMSIQFKMSDHTIPSLKNRNISIVLPISDKTILVGSSLISQIRTTFGIPILLEVIYCKDLSKENRLILTNKYKDLEFIDICEKAWKQGWDRSKEKKDFGLFCSSLEHCINRFQDINIAILGLLLSNSNEIILMDVNIELNQNPIQLLDYSIYKNTGALFFMDNQIKSRKNTDDLYNYIMNFDEKSFKNYKIDFDKSHLNSLSNSLSNEEYLTYKHDLTLLLWNKNKQSRTTAILASFLLINGQGLPPIDNENIFLFACKLSGSPFPFSPLQSKIDIQKRKIQYFPIQERSHEILYWRIEYQNISNINSRINSTLTISALMTYQPDLITFPKSISSSSFKVSPLDSVKKPNSPNSIAIVTYLAKDEQKPKGAAIDYFSKYDEYQKIVPFALTNMMQYAETNGHAFYPLNNHLTKNLNLGERQAFWGKPSVVKKYLSLGFEWVLWTDIDVLFLDMTKPLTYWTNQATSNHSIILVNECDSNQRAARMNHKTIRSGFFLIRSTEIGKDFLNEWMSMYHSHKSRHNPDQEALEDLCSQGKYSPYIKIFDAEDFHSYPHCIEKHNTPNVFSVHFPGPYTKSFLESWFHNRVRQSNSGFDLDEQKLSMFISTPINNIKK